jgi:hypothetical protein
LTSGWRSNALAESHEHVGQQLPRRARAPGNDGLGVHLARE